ENGIVGEYRKDRTGAEAYEAFLQKLVSWADNSWWTVAALVFVALCWLYELFVAESFLYAATLPPLWLRILTLLVYTPIMYAVFLNVVRLLVILIFTNWLSTCTLSTSTRWTRMAPPGWGSWARCFRSVCC